MGRLTDPRLPPAYWHFSQAVEGRQPWIDQAMEEKRVWDDELRHDYRDVTEWVPTHELKKFMEYDRRPGKPDAHSSPERWNALADHIKDNGFANAVVLDFNPDTGHAHMSEGNHRTQIALDAGIPHMPVRVYRSRRTSPTQIPVNPQPQPEWENHRGDTHWPSDIRPSHIGLPTVPPPSSQGDLNSTLSKTASAIDIIEGTTEPDGSVWKNVGRAETQMPALYSEKDGHPAVYLGKGGTHHADLIHEFDLPLHTVDNWASVDTDGYHDCSPTFPSDAMQQLRDHVTHHHGTDFEDRPDGWSL